MSGGRSPVHGKVDGILLLGKEEVEDGLSVVALPCGVQARGLLIPIPDLPGGSGRAGVAGRAGCQPAGWTTPPPQEGRLFLEPTSGSGLSGSSGSPRSLRCWAWVSASGGANGIV